MHNGRINVHLIVECASDASSDRWIAQARSWMDILVRPSAQSGFSSLSTSVEFFRGRSLAELGTGQQIDELPWIANISAVIGVSSCSQKDRSKLPTAGTVEGKI
mgnify:CR=1 FL=1